MEFKLNLKKIKTPTDANWNDILTGGYLNIKGRVYDFSRVKEGYKNPDGTIQNPYEDANGYWKATAELTGLISPFTNPISNAAVSETRIEVSFEDTRGWGKDMGETYYEYIATSAKSLLEKKYAELFGVRINLTAIEVAEPPIEEAPPATITTTTEIASATASVPGPTASETTASVSAPTASNIDGEFTFNVEQEGKFIGNNQFGTLYIVGIGEIKDEKVEMLEDITSDEFLDEEYSEESFSGEEEQAFVMQQTGDFLVINSESTNSIKGYDPENPNEALSTNSDAKYPISKNTNSNIEKIIEVAKNSGITNKYSIAAMLSICKKESGFIPQNEASYAATNASRIKSVFSKFKKYSDSEVDRIKNNHKEFFDIIYGGKYGNSATEGYKYRGRGLNQITFKGNYKKYKELSGYDIVSDPDLLNKIDVAAKCLVEYFKSNFKSAPKSIEAKYNFDNINSFKNLDDAMGAFYHANAGWGKGYNELVADSTGGRAKSFKYVGPIYNTYLKA